MTYLSLNEYMKKRFGTKVYRLSLQTGCTCPNRDGKISFGGCTFCSEGGSGDFAAPLLDLPGQIELAKAKVDGKFPKNIKPEDRRYIAYFQSYTNTYGEVAVLKNIFEQVLAYPEIVAISIGTRPDCLADDMLSMLSDLNKKKEVWIELGLQTMHDKTAVLVNRGYDLAVFEDAWRRLKTYGLTGIVHLIFGLPGETKEDMLQSVRYLSELEPGIDGIKLQLLHVLKGTKMGADYEQNPFPVMSLEEYSDLIAACLKILPEKVVIHRITGDAPKRLLIAPKWSADKKKVLNTLNKKIREA